MNILPILSVFVFFSCSQASIVYTKQELNDLITYMYFGDVNHKKFIWVEDNAFYIDKDTVNCTRTQNNGIRLFDPETETAKFLAIMLEGDGITLPPPIKRLCESIEKDIPGLVSFNQKLIRENGCTPAASAMLEHIYNLITESRFCTGDPEVISREADFFLSYYKTNMYKKKPSHSEDDEENV